MKKILASLPLYVFVLLLVIVAGVFTGCDTHEQITNITILQKGGDTIIIDGNRIGRDTINPPGANPPSSGNNPGKLLYYITLRLHTDDVPGGLILDSSNVDAQYFSTKADVIDVAVSCTPFENSVSPKYQIQVECFSLRSPSQIMRWKYVDEPSPRFKIYRSDFKAGVGETLCYQVAAIDTSGRLLSRKRVIYLTCK